MLSSVWFMYVLIKFAFCHFYYDACCYFMDGQCGSETVHWRVSITGCSIANYQKVQDTCSLVPTVKNMTDRKKEVWSTLFWWMKLKASYFLQCVQGCRQFVREGEDSAAALPGQIDRTEGREEESEGGGGGGAETKRRGQRPSPHPQQTSSTGNTAALVGSDRKLFVCLFVFMSKISQIRFKLPFTQKVFLCVSCLHIKVKATIVMFVYGRNSSTILIFYYFLFGF